MINLLRRRRLFYLQLCYSNSDNCNEICDCVQSRCIRHVSMNWIEAQSQRDASILARDCIIWLCYYTRDTVKNKCLLTVRRLIPEPNLNLLPISNVIALERFP
jgi:hypothetical protein